MVEAERTAKGVDVSFTPESWEGTCMLIELLGEVKKKSGVVPDSFFSNQPVLVGYDSLAGIIPKGFEFACLRAHEDDNYYLMRSDFAGQERSRSLCPFTPQSVHFWFFDNIWVKMTDWQMVEWSKKVAGCLKKNGLAVAINNSVSIDFKEKMICRAYGFRLRSLDKIKKLVCPERRIFEPLLKMIMVGLDARKAGLAYYVFARSDSDFPIISKDPVEYFGDSVLA